MKRKIIIILGILIAIVGSASPVRARTTEEITVSKEPLNLESLTVKDDYKEFFGISEGREKISLNPENFNNFDGRDDGVFYDGDDGVWEINEQLELQVNEPVAPQVFPAFPRLEGASLFNGIERLELQYELSK